MRIGIDTLAAHYRKTGIGTYISSLANALPLASSEHEFCLLASHENQAIFVDGLARTRKVLGPRVIDHTPVRVVWEHLCLPGVARREAVDLLHGATFVAPLLWRGPLVITIHDLTWFTHPGQHVPTKRLYYQRLIPAAARRAARIIAITESTRQDILRILRVPEERVIAVPYGVDGIFRPLADPGTIADVGQKHGIGGPYLLFVGMLEPRKNLVRLVQAYGRLRAVRPDLVHRLVLAGNKGWGYMEARQEVDRLGLAGDVLFTGAVPHAELPALFCGADLFVYPSLYEGFGLPVLEAMACGTPVITSNVSSLPEVAGEAALLVDPLDMDALAEAMARALDDPALRRRMRAKGLEQAGRFTWEETARRTLQVYEEAYALSRGPAVAHFKRSGSK